jgi:hypothetical protein
MRNTLENGAGEPIGKAALHITANFTLHNLCGAQHKLCANRIPAEFARMAALKVSLG